MSAGKSDQFPAKPIFAFAVTMLTIATASSRGDILYVMRKRHSDDPLYVR